MRKPMVTRSFEVTRVNVMMCNTITSEVHNKEFEVPRTYKDNDKLMKVVKSMVETDSDKVVTIVDKSVATFYVRYGSDSIYLLYDYSI